MAEEEKKEEKKPEVAASDGDGSTKKDGPNILMILILVLLLVIIGAGVFLFFTESGRNMIGLGAAAQQSSQSKRHVPELPENITYYELPEMLINVHSNSGKRKPYLRLLIKLELHDPETVATLDLIKPRIIDSFQVYLRELRVEDLEGSSGSQRLKEELLKRVNAVAAPAVVDDVLFQTFVVQ